jgi:exodeoxyribonuclease VII large subunit
MPSLKDSLTVEEFVQLVNASLEPMEGIAVTGEVSQYKVIHNKWVTFTLKDDKAGVNCFMTIWQLRTQIEDGMLVRVMGRPRLREKGFFSFVLSNVQPAGEGALKRAFELLRQKLEKEGLFAPERKRSLPRFPARVALITSRDAAAYMDFLKVLQARLGGLEINLLHTQVQGNDAPAQIIRAIEYANTYLRDIDVIVLVRGGGSMEDLQAFNEESVARAVASSRIRTLVGIGHERDVTLAELVADARASTPSNAAELLVRSREELLSQLNEKVITLKQITQTSLARKQQRLQYYAQVMRERVRTGTQQVTQTMRQLDLNGQRIRREIAVYYDQTVSWKTQLSTITRNWKKHKLDHLIGYERLLKSLSPENVLQRGYSIARNAKGDVIKSAKQVQKDDWLAVELWDGKVETRVEKANFKR